MRGWILAAVVSLAAGGCGAAADDGTRDPRTTGDGAAAVSSAVERCTERFLQNAELDELPEAEREAARRYVETTYCSRFAERGWVYDDGALSIDAHTWLEQVGEEECEEAGAAQEGEPAKPARTVPCDELDAGAQMIDDCALLQHVRRSEVREYLNRLRSRHGGAECADGTPLRDLGVP